MVDCIQNHGIKKKSTQHWQVESYDLVQCLQPTKPDPKSCLAQDPIDRNLAASHHCKILYHHALLSVSRELHVAMTFVLNPLLRTIDGDQQSPVQPWIPPACAHVLPYFWPICSAFRLQKASNASRFVSFLWNWNWQIQNQERETTDIGQRWEHMNQPVNPFDFFVFSLHLLTSKTIFFCKHPNIYLRPTTGQATCCSFVSSWCQASTSSSKVAPGKWLDLMGKNLQGGTRVDK